MAVVDISEYSLSARDTAGHIVQAPVEPSQTVQQITIAGTSAASAAFGKATKMIRVHAETAVRFAIGAAPVASATSPRIPAGGTEYFGVIPGLKIAVISTS